MGDDVRREFVGRLMPILLESFPGYEGRRIEDAAGAAYAAVKRALGRGDKDGDYRILRPYQTRLDADLI